MSSVLASASLQCLGSVRAYSVYWLATIVAIVSKGLCLLHVKPFYDRNVFDVVSVNYVFIAIACKLIYQNATLVQLPVSPLSCVMVTLLYGIVSR